MTDYAKLIAPQHRQPRFTDVVRAITDPLNLSVLRGRYDLDAATGAELDAIGDWVGASRYFATPLTDVYFSFDTDDVGFDEGTWYEEFNPTTELTRLPDEYYRLLLRAQIAANEWDGTREGAYEAWRVMFARTDITLGVLDNGDMSIVLVFGGTLDAVTKGLINAGALDLKPVGVSIAARICETPIFGFDSETSVINGFDVAFWS